ncbi:23S rRNA (pseudouridine(1915)-N(3))-methyltransferase RlmH [bacterium]|nr:23S rRNA (pseudouridine(1915)-N(3))-methyltransferase RlmH [bacterium]
MNIKILAFGKIKEDFLKQGINEFLKRLTPYTGMEIVELTPIEVKDDALIEKVLNDEAEKALSLIKPSDYVVTMEIEGKNLSSEQFAEKIKDIQNSGVQQLVFVIGSSCGLGEKIKARANFKLSLSKMTFLHQFSRLILVEQIYRAFKIMNNETYHK